MALGILIIIATITVVVTNKLLTDRFTETTRNRAELRLALYSGNVVSELQRNSVVPLLLAQDPALIGALNSGDFSQSSGRLISFLEEIGAASILLFLSTSTTSPYERPWDWDELDRTDEAIATAVARLDEDVPVRASPSALPALSQRPWLFPLSVDNQPNPVNMGFPAFTRAVLVVEREIPRRTPTERVEFDRSMALRGFELDFESQGVALYVRG